MAAPPNGVLFNEARAKPLSTTGAIQPGAYYQFYLTGTLTLTNVYSDGNVLIPLSQTPGTGGTTAASDGRLVPIYLNPAIVYRYQLYSAAGALLEDVDPYVPVSVPTQAQIGQVLYPQTATELAISITPTNYAFPADPYVDPRRYGADPTGVADSTVQMQIALTVATQAKGCVWIGNACTYLVGPVSATLSTGQSIRILGSSTRGSRLLAKTGLTNTALLTIKSSAPATVLVDCYSELESFTIQGAAGGITTGVHGLSLQGLAKVDLSAMLITAFDRGIDAQNVLTWTVERNTEIILNNTGIKATLVGTSFTANLWRIQNSQININNIYGIDFNNGTGLYVSQCDMEANGTSANFTANPLIGATSGTLTAVWPLDTGTYACYFPNGETRSVTLTKNATTATWSSGLAAGQTASWLGTPTGAVLIGPTCSPDLLEGNIVFERVWFEANKGGWTFNHMAQTNGNRQRLTLSSCEWIASPNGQALMVGGAYLLDLRNADAEGNTPPNVDTFNLTASSAILTNVFCPNLIDSGIGQPFYFNVATAVLGGKTANGRYDTFTGTLTGFAAPPTATIAVVQQGQEVTLVTPDLLGNPSSTTSCTITGLPAKYQTSGPGGIVFLPCIVTNNGVDNISMALLTNASGTIALYQGGSQTGFTAAGQKGVRKQNLRYRLDL